MLDGNNNIMETILRILIFLVPLIIYMIFPYLMDTYYIYYIIIWVILVTQWSLLPLFRENVRRAKTIQALQLGIDMQYEENIAQIIDTIGQHLSELDSTKHTTYLYTLINEILNSTSPQEKKKLLERLLFEL